MLKEDIGFFLQSNSKNNYSEVNGLQLDMKPSIGAMAVKTILIDKNDNAEGIIQFDVPGGNFKGESAVSENF